MRFQFQRAVSARPDLDLNMNLDYKESEEQALILNEMQFSII